LYRKRGTAVGERRCLFLGTPLADYLSSM